MMTSSPTSPASVGELLAQRYRIGEPLAAGSAGTVFAGRDERTHGEVIIKFFDGDADPFRPWLDEARAALQLRHPNVIACLNLGLDDGSGLHFLVLDRAFGGSLRRTMRDLPRFGAAQVREVLVDIGRGLDYAHQRGVIHRDVKPENIVAHHEAGKPPWLITDFGSSRFVPGGSRAASIVGSAQYIAPEIMQRDATAACDQYSLGITALELWMGAAPTAAERAEFLLTSAADSVQPGAELTTRVRAVIAALVQPDRSRRLPGMAAVGEILESEHGFATSALADGTVVAWIGDEVLVADADQRCIARRIEVPRARGLVSQRGAPRAVVAAPRRLVAVSRGEPLATLYASDHGFHCVAASERRGKVALERHAGEIEIVRLGDGEVEELIAPPAGWAAAARRGAFLADGRLALFAISRPELVLLGGGEAVVLTMDAPVREVVELDDDLAVITGDRHSASVQWLGSGVRQRFAASADRVTLVRGRAHLVPEAIELLAAERR
jgi:hypothetical protein